MEKNSRTEMLPGKRDFYRSCKARRSASHVEFWQQFQNYAPPSLWVIRTKFARTIIYNIYIRDSQLNRPESVSLASLACQLLQHITKMSSLQSNLRTDVSSQESLLLITETSFPV